MSTFINVWNAIALDWGMWLANAAVQSACILALVAGLWLLIRKRGSAHFGYALFLLPFVPLAIPSLWSLQLDSAAPSALTNLLPSKLFAQHQAGTTSTDAALFGLMAENGSAAGLAEQASDSASTTADVLASAELQTADTNAELQATAAGVTAASALSSTPTWIAWTFLTWILFTLGMLIAFVRTQIRTARQVATTRSLSAHDAKRVCVVLDRLGAPSNIQVLECTGVSGPAAWGVRKPSILFPPDMIEELDDSQLAWVIGHELAHHKRLDLLMGAAQRILRIVWFFHPLVWWQCRRLDHLRECACDETAQARTQTRGKLCAQALLQVAAKSSLPQNSRFALQTLHNDKNTMKQRIHRLMNTKRSARAGMTPLAIPMLLLAAGISTTTFRFQNTETSTTDAITTSAIGKAQSWLIDQQMPDGHWPAGPGFDQAAGEFTTVGITGLVLISLENADESITAERRDKAVKLGLGYLKEPLESADSPSKKEQRFQALASHAVATQAWLNAHKNAAGDGWRTTATKAIHVLIKSRNPYGGWGYEFVPNGDTNTFNTVLAMRALATAKGLGFDIPKDAYEGSSTWLDSMTNKKSGKVGYNWGGPHQFQDVRLIAKKESHPVKYTELCTAMSILGQEALGTEITESKEIMLGLGLLASKAPAWNASASNVDYYYWYFGMEAMSLAGGVFEQKWKDSLNEVLQSKQLGGKGLIGSFPAVDAWSDSKATVHATVMATLALQAAE